MFLRVLVLFLSAVSLLFLARSMQAKADCPEPTGKVVEPGNPDYDKARLVSNYYTSKKKFPHAIVYCSTTRDVQNAILWAECQKLPVRIRSGGHNHEGFSTGNRAVIIDVSKMKAVKIDKEKKQVILEPGITGGELYALLAKEGLTQAGGTCADVGLSGLVLTGGMGPLSRMHGLTCDTLVSFEMVDASGNVLQVTKDNEHKDLFWACCGGGGGNFGVVTSLVLNVFPAEQVTWFNIGWDWEEPVDQIVKGWQKFFFQGDKRWFSHLDVWAKAFKKDELKKQPIKIIGVFYGSPEEARQLLEPLLTIGKPSSLVIERVNWHKSIQEFEDATTVFLTDKPEYKSTGAFAMQPLPDEAVNITVDTLRNSENPLLNFLMFSLGGSISDKSPSDTAYFYRNAKYFVCYSSQWLKENDDVTSIKELDTLRNRLLPYTEGDYTGNPDLSLKDPLKVYYGNNVERLREVKKRYDPKDIFSFEQGIKP